MCVSCVRVDGRVSNVLCTCVSPMSDNPVQVSLASFSKI